MKTTTKFAMTLAGLATTLGAAAQIAMADPIGVQVNGTPVQFSGTQPIERNGAVLVPLRGVFEAMGATVSYDSSSRTIYANQGAKNVTLPLGATMATVDGRQQSLSQPAQVVGGTTLVPLRFVAEALGSYVEWQSASNTVLIQPNGNTPVAYAPVDNGSNNVPDQSYTPDQHPGRIHQMSSVSGTIRSITAGQIVVNAAGQDQTFSITDRTSLVQSNPANSAVQIAWSDLNVGDFVTVKARHNGDASSVAANYGVVAGRVGNVNIRPDGAKEIVLRDGTVVPLTRGAMVSKNGDTVGFGQVLPGDRVTIRTNPNNDRGYDVTVGTVYAHRR